MDPHQLSDTDKQHSPATGPDIHARLWIWFIDLLRWILCTLSEHVTAFELWALGSDESHKQAVSTLAGPVRMSPNNSWLNRIGISKRQNHIHPGRQQRWKRILLRSFSGYGFQHQLDIRESGFRAWSFLQGDNQR